MEEPTIFKVISKNDLEQLSQLLAQDPGLVDGPGKDGEYPLQAAIRYGLPHVIRLLLKAGADPWVKDRDGRTPLHIAINRAVSNSNSLANLAEIIKVLLETAPDLVHQGDGQQNTPLHLAARLGSSEAAEVLLAHNAQITARNAQGRTPLHDASGTPGAALVDYLLARGADLEAVDHEGQTPLHVAAEASHKAVQVLLRAGASPHARDMRNNLPFHNAWANPAVQAELSEAANRVRTPRLRFGFVDKRGATPEGMVLEVEPSWPVHHINREICVYGNFHICTLEEERRGWGSKRPIVLEADETAEDVARRVNPFFGKLQPADYDDVIVLGRYFVFCRAGRADPTLLAQLGLSAPTVVPRFGINQGGQSPLDLYLDPCGRPLPSWSDLLVLATTRSVYAPGQEVVAVAMGWVAAGPAPKKAEVGLLQAGTVVPNSEQTLSLGDGLAFIRWPNLAPGHYEAVIQWGKQESRYSFTVGRHSLSLGQAEWSEAPRLNLGRWRGRVRLFSHGRPLGPKVRVAVTLGLGPVREAVTDSRGEIVIDLERQEDPATSLHLAWGGEHLNEAYLSFPSPDSLKGGEVQVSLAPGLDTVEVSGLHLALQPSPLAPLQLLRTNGEKVELLATEDIEAGSVTFLGPGGVCQTTSLGSVPAGSLPSLPLPPELGAVCFVCLGVLSQNRVYETAFPFFRPSSLQVSCEVAPRFAAGEPFEISIQVHGPAAAKATVGVVIQDSRLLFPFTPGLRKRRLSDLQAVAETVEGTPAPPFSVAWLDATLQILPTKKSRQKRYHPLMVDNLSTRGEGRGLIQMTLQGLSSLIPGPADPGPRRVIRLSSADQPEELPATSTLFAGLVKTHGGRAQLSLVAPPDATRLAIQVLVVDPGKGAFATCEATMAVSAPLEIWTDAVPTAMLPGDRGEIRSRISVVSTVGPVAVEATLDGQTRPLWVSPGKPLSGNLEATGGRDLWFNLEPGLWTFRAAAGGRQTSRSLRVQFADQLAERVVRLVVVAEGDSLEIGPGDHIDQLRPTTLMEMLGVSSQSLADYRFLCCEQTAAAMLGAWATILACGGRIDSALSSVSTGLGRLNSLWRQDGFALYPGQARASRPFGYFTYLHLAGMRVYAQALGPAQAIQAGPVLQQLDALLKRCRAVYGNLPLEQPTTCHEAWLDSNRDRALRFVRERWHPMEGGIFGIYVAGDAVTTRAETCYAAAVLLSEPEAVSTYLPEVWRTLTWVGSHLNGEGRLYSTFDSAAFLALLATGRRHFPGSGLLSLDEGPPLDTASARIALERRLPRKVTSVKGFVSLLIQATIQSKVGDTTLSSGLVARFERDGGAIERASLGERVQLVLAREQYQPGLLAHVVLPPCLAVEDGGARLQSFSRDFEGATHLRIPVRAVERTGLAPWHGFVALRNMFREEQRDGISLAFCVD